MKYVACVTTRNEINTVAGLVQGLLCYVDDVVVVDAGSTDGTAESARAAGAFVRRLEHVGIGPALLVAWREALGLRGERIVQLDAGGSHLPSNVPLLLQGLDDADVVVGSRFRPGAKYVGGSLQRRLGSRLAAFGCNLSSDYTLTDWTSGYRAFRAVALRRLMLDPHYMAEMHGWQIEVLGRAIEHHMRIGEVPITYIAGRSSFNWRIAAEACRAWGTL